MSTTVIASRHGPLLALLPVASPATDVAQVQQVLARHGLTLAASSDLARTNEFIAAQGLDPERAAALADDLRAVGLTVRVVNQTDLTRSARVGNALAAQMLGGMFAFGAFAIGFAPILDALKDGGAFATWPLPFMAAGLAAMLAFAFNALVLQRGGGTTLGVAGGGALHPTSRQLADQLSELEALLPEHVAAPLLARARRLQEHARSDPEGEAARELGALVEELRQLSDQEAAEDVRQLRDEVRRARQAVRETR